MDNRFRYFDVTNSNLPEDLKKAITFAIDTSHEEDALTVLRGHLRLEVSLGELLATRFPGFDRLAPSIDFSKKARIALDEQIIDDRTYQLLNGLGRLRNSFSHPPLKFEITDADIAAFIRTAPPWYAPFINIPDHPAIGFDFRKPGMSPGRLKVRLRSGCFIRISRR